MRQFPRTDRMPTGARDFWVQWGSAFARVKRLEEVAALLTGAANAFVDAMASSAGGRALGIDVVDVDMPDRSAGIIDRWDRKTVLVDRRHSGRDREFVIAHEVAHLLLGYVQRSGLLINRDHEEQLCDHFAEEALKTGRRAESAGADRR